MYCQFLIIYNITLLFSLQKFEEIGKFPFETTVDGDPDVAATTALTGVVNECFPTIRDWIKWFFKNEPEVQCGMHITTFI